VNCPTIQHFQQNHFQPAIPVIINGATQHWPCLRPESGRRWTLDYLLATAGYRTVALEIGSKYTDESWSQKLMTIKEFVEQHFVEDIQSKGYLAQQELFTQIKELSSDFSVPDYCCMTRVNEQDDDENSSGAGCNVVVNAWFGPWSTVSPLHHDPYDNLFSQVIGCKYVRLYPSTTDPSMIYPYDGQFLDNTSQVDMDNYDANIFPLFASLPYLDCVLQPGQILYIPKGWWHYVRSLSTSFSINFWWI
jgi:lysine-specific demethylase 8